MSQLKVNKKIPYLLALICALFSALKMHAQEPVMQHFGLENGLSSSTVYKIFQDSHGYIWFATDAGLDKYNGTEFVNYGIIDGLPDGAIYDIYEDSEARIWLISQSGKLCYYQNGRFYTNPFNGILKNYRITALIEKSKGTMLISTFNNTLLEVTNNSVTWKSSLKTLENSGIYQFIRVKDTIVGIDNTSFVIIKNNQVTETFVRPGRSFSRMRLKNIDGKCFFSNMYGVGFLADTNQIYVNSTFNLKYSDEVFDLLEASTKKIWLGTKNGVLIAENSLFERVEAFYLEKKMVSSLCQDREGNIWIATLGDGVYIIPLNGFLVFKKNKALTENQILCVSGDNKGQIWAGDNSGFVYLIKNSEIFAFNTVRNDQRNTYNRITDITCDSFGNVIAGTDHAVAIFTNNKLGTICPASAIKKVLIKQDTVFAGSSSLGLNKAPFQDLYKPFLTVELSQEIIPSIHAFTFSNNTFYICGKDKFYAYTRNKIKILFDSFLTSKVIMDVGISDKVFWFATHGYGVIRIEAGKATFFNTRNGLSSNFCNSIFITHDGIWVGTKRGINLISIRTNKIIKKLGYKEGLPSEEVNDLFVDADGGVWAGTNSGLAYMPPFKTQHKITRPLVNIEAITINNRKYFNSTSLILPYDSSKILLKVAGMSHLYKNNITFLYKLDGFDTVWTNTSLPLIQYSSLPAGDYNFLVKAVTPYGIISSHAASLHIIIQKPYWQKTWFLILASFGLLLLVTGIGFIILSIIRFNERKKTEISRRITDSEVKALRAQMNPHFLFNSMNSIQHYILKSDKKSANEYLAKFAKLMRMMLENSKKQSITLYDEILFLRLYLELESLRFENKLSYSILFKEDLPLDDIHLPSMIIQPMVENAIKHGIAHKKEGGNIEIRFLLRDDYLYCYIRDNGIGRKKASAISKANAEFHIGTGLNTTLDRINLLSANKEKKAVMKINDLKDDEGHSSGTEIEIAIPCFEEI